MTVRQAVARGQTEAIDVIELGGVPDLVDPVMIAAFEGWNDAGDAASGAIAHLEEIWGAQPLAALDPEDYYDFQVNRPLVSIGADGERDLTWPTTQISVARQVLGGRDVVLVRGIEPNIRWRSFVTELIDIADELDVAMVVVLGALLADVPHTRPVPLTATTGNADLRAELGLTESTYQGPTGIVGVLQDACSRTDIPSLAVWAAVPHYVAQPPCPKATLALLSRVEDLLDARIPTGDLPEDARAWELGVDELAAEDPEVAEYVRTLEEAKDATELPEASGEAIAREFERYLRRRSKD
jgi:proteasome assembly chaperone (PAC2) family protein